MYKSIVFLAGLMASSVALAGPYLDAPASGVRASYSLGFGGSGQTSLKHSLALQAGFAPVGYAPSKVAELRWDAKGSELLVAGRPFSAPSANADEKKGGWKMSDQQALYLIAAVATLAGAVAVADYRDSDGPKNPIGTGGSSSN